MLQVDIFFLSDLVLVLLNLIIIISHIQKLLFGSLKDICRLVGWVLAIG